MPKICASNITLLGAVYSTAPLEISGAFLQLTEETITLINSRSFVPKEEH